MANRSRVPRPPVQAPRRRDTRGPVERWVQSVPGWAWVGIGLLIAAAAGAGVYEATRGGSSAPPAAVPGLGRLTATPAPGPLGPEGVPIPRGAALAPAGWLRLDETRDGVSCQPTESVAYHVHSHLTIFVDGVARRVPYGIGIAPPRSGQTTPGGFFVTGGSCFAWLHTHAGDGIIHIESPTTTTYTLGEFFDLWGVPLGPNRVGPARGRVVAFVNGHLHAGSPRLIPLRKHAQIQLDIGGPLVAPESIRFPNGL
jgi:hypothetical protein